MCLLGGLEHIPAVYQQECQFCLLVIFGFLYLRSAIRLDIRLIKLNQVDFLYRGIMNIYVCRHWFCLC